MEVTFISDYQSRVLLVEFPEGSTLASVQDIAALRRQWLAALKSWHSPYKALVDISKLAITGPHEVLGPELEKLFLFLKGFFLQRAIGYGSLPEATKALFPFPIYEDFEDAKRAVGLRQPKVAASSEDLRQQLHVDNHFPQRVIELTVSQAVSLDSPEKLQILKSKLLNILMQWHSPWTLMIDCSQLTIPRDQHAAFQELITFFKGFYMVDILGYGSRLAKEEYPFPVYRARHIASAQVKTTIPQAGDEANCATRKP